MADGRDSVCVLGLLCGVLGQVEAGLGAGKSWCVQSYDECDVSALARVDVLIGTGDKCDER